jgi:hypothetical protein
MKDNYYGTDDHKLTLLPPFEHKEKRNDDDLGLPHDPIYANYSKYLWKAHKRSGGIQIKGVDDRTEPKSR